MGTYTTNYNLFMPTIGEQGWGTLINGNFIAIDTAMNGLNTRLTTVENEVNGALSCTSVTTSGTITSNGVLNANGGVNGGAITGTTITATNKFSGILYGKIYVDGQYSTSGGITTAASCPAQSVSSTTTATTSSTITVGGYTYPTISYPLKVSSGVYIESKNYVSGNLPAQLTSRTLTFTFGCRQSFTNSTGYYFSGRLFVNGTNVYSTTSRKSGSFSGTLDTYTYSVKPGDTVYVVCNAVESLLDVLIAKASIPAATTYYIKAND